MICETHTVLLNTSFNIQGKPILNTYKEAMWMKENTGVDEIITDKYIIMLRAIKLDFDWSYFLPQNKTTLCIKAVV